MPISPPVRKAQSPADLLYNARCFYCGSTLKPNSSSYYPAGLLVRLMSLMYDLFLLFAVGFVYSSLVMLLVTSLGAEPQHLQLSSSDEGLVMRADDQYQPLLQGIFFQLGLGATVLAFYLGFWRWRGATLGMQTWRLHLTNLDGKPPSFRQLVLRSLLGLVSFSCLGLGYVWILFDQRKLAFHDRFSGTRIVRESKK